MFEKRVFASLIRKRRLQKSQRAQKENKRITGVLSSNDLMGAGVWQS